jgi:hypothetical protein
MVNLDYEQSYPCPVCGRGTIAPMTLMDAYGCNGCRHIFSANLMEQVLRTEDIFPPRIWRWNGQRWRSGRSANGPVSEPDLAILVWLGAMVIGIMPPLLVWLPSQIFPPLDGSQADWFPQLWLGIVTLIHGSISGGLLAEYYQWRWYLQLRDRWDNLFTN